MSSSVPEAATVRRAADVDAESAADLFRDLQGSLGIRRSATPAEMREWWSHADLPGSSWVFEESARMLAIGWLGRRGEATEASGAVRPVVHGRGFGTAIAERSEVRTRELAVQTVRHIVYGADRAACALFESRGYHAARRFYEMLIDLDGPPPEPAWPDGIRPATFRPDDARAFHAASTEAFAGEWGAVPMPFEEWLRLRVERADTSLYFIAWDGEEVAGCIRCEPELRGVGWVGMLGVRRAWRGRGIGEALLLHAFGEFYRRGERRVGLGVDSENPTGATRLYERVGMRATVEDVVYEKEIA